MRASEVWGRRWVECDSALSRRYMELACEKQSLVILAADRNTMEDLNQLVEEVSDYVVAIKTHVDLIDDWSHDAWMEFVGRASRAGLMIFEDRKHGDIGKIVRDQMSGIYDARSWADLMTAHLISGTAVLDGMMDAWSGVGREGGVLLLAQMSSSGNLLELPGYTDAVVAAGKVHSACFGFIGNGSRPSELSELRKLVGDGRIIWTPGVNLVTGDGELGQRYGDPRDAVLSGSDGIIVGSGIHGSDVPRDSAKAYAEVSWKALVERGR